MKYILRDGVWLAYSEMGEGSRSFVFVHGWTCPRSHFAPQIEHFARTTMWSQ
jgi:pimeloyl-ACP methyl ester carboxylesterase